MWTAPAMCLLAITSLFTCGLATPPHSWAVGSSHSFLGSGHEKDFTTNPICQRRFCVNPVFPALEDLQRLDETQWVASTLRDARPHIRFCQAAVDYDPSIMYHTASNQNAGSDIAILEADDAAATMFYYHLNAMGYDAWDYPKPEFADDCVRSVWRMVCYSYFPRAEAGAQDGRPSRYLRPCQSSCENYVRACNVECCDESVQCVFEHSVTHQGVAMPTAGYAPHDAPSSLCTGGAHRSSRVPHLLLLVLVLLQLSGCGATLSEGFRVASRSAAAGRVLWASALASAAFALQGCNEDVPTHHIGNWRKEDDFLVEFEFIPPGGSTASATLNSCSMNRLSQALQCSGRGVCKLWDETNINNPISFCSCDAAYADPECRTERKSQVIAYLLSLFLGLVGADHFYLGYFLTGTIKMVTLGGFGIWWAIDVIRVGSSPVETPRFRVANDLPHSAFVLGTVAFGLTVGIMVVLYTTHGFQARRRKYALHVQRDEESDMGPQYRKAFESRQTYSSMGSGIPAKMITT